METPETIEVLNKRLLDFYGKFETGDANFRIVFSDDQTEKQECEYTKDGFQLLTPEIREVKKYSWIHSKYVLERIIPVPEFQIPVLGRKVSYEPIWVFQTEDNQYLPPVWDVIVILLNTLLDQTLYEKKPYKIPEGEGNTLEEIEHRVNKMEELLYGNESPITDALSVGSAIGAGEYRRDDTRFNSNSLKVH